jgi:hypothetical protein
MSLGSDLLKSGIKGKTENPAAYWNSIWEFKFEELTVKSGNKKDLRFYFLCQEVRLKLKVF